MVQREKFCSRPSNRPEESERNKERRREKSMYFDNKCLWHASKFRQLEKYYILGKKNYEIWEVEFGDGFRWQFECFQWESSSFLPPLLIFLATPSCNLPCFTFPHPHTHALTISLFTAQFPSPVAKTWQLFFPEESLSGRRIWTEKWHLGGRGCCVWPCPCLHHPQILSWRSCSSRRGKV